MTIEPMTLAYLLAIWGGTRPGNDAVAQRHAADLQSLGLLHHNGELTQLGQRFAAWVAQSAARKMHEFCG
ncbi:MAG: hypothetical protein U1A27_00155 [Phycisphaerae bacterium]